MAEVFKVGETVKYLSSYDYTWKTGSISRFTEDGITTVAIIWETNKRGETANKVRLKDLKKIESEG